MNWLDPCPRSSHFGCMTSRLPESPAATTRPSTSWSTERLFFDGEHFFDELSWALRQAKESVDINVYIWEPDSVGLRIANEVWSCHQRGLKVRMVVDGFGALSWIRSREAKKFFDAKIMRIYHPLPWTLSDLPAFSNYWWRRWLRINSRSHLKLLVADQKLVIGGSRNVNEDSRDWREICYEVTGQEVPAVCELFNTTWNLSHDFAGGRALARLAATKTPGSTLHTELVFHTRTSGERKHRYRDLMHRIGATKNRLWIATPYFHPVSGLRKALARKASEGVDVRLILPKVSDVWFSTWINESYCDRLCTAGIKVYRYLPEVLHAKVILGDDWAIVGSSNLNHRSFLRDLEIDVVLNSPASLSALEKELVRDMENSDFLESPQQIRGLFFKKMLSRMMYYFRDSF